MLFAKLLLSPMPHARVRGIDTSARSRCPASRRSSPPTTCPDLGTAAETSALTNEPLYAGEPILAVAAVDEATAAEAIEAIDVDLEPLPFVVDPLDSLRPAGPNARLEGNVWAAPRPPTPGGQPPAPPALADAEVDREDFADDEGDGPAADGQGRSRNGRSAISTPASRKPTLVLDETFVVQSTGHQPMETRSAMAYWQNGKLYLHGSTQSVAATVAAIARWVGIDAVATSC